MAKSGASDAVISAVARAGARLAAGGKVEEQIEMLPPSRFNKVDDAGRHHRMTETIIARIENRIERMPATPR